jgi:hypothetical protein
MDSPPSAADSRDSDPWALVPSPSKADGRNLKESHAE